MRKDRDSRRPQRRGFDDDNYSPPPNFGYAPRESSPRFDAAPTGPPISATVKWYNPEKGLGFVELPSGGDALRRSTARRGPLWVDLTRYRTGSERRQCDANPAFRAKGANCRVG